MKKILNIKSLFIISVLINIYFFFTPKEVKILKTEHIKTIVDTKEINRLKKQIQQLEKQRIEEKKNLEIVEIIREIKYPDGRIEIVTEKRTIDKTETKIDNVVSSSETMTTEQIKEEQQQTETKVVTKTEIQKQQLWTTSFGYNYFGRQIEVGQGVNLWKFTFLGCGIYYIDTNKFDIGGKIMFKY